MTIDNKQLLKRLEDTLFFFTPRGHDCCDGRLQRQVYCVKVQVKPVIDIDCKYLSKNLEYPTLSHCFYNKENKK